MSNITRGRIPKYIFVVVLWGALHSITTSLERFVITPVSSQNISDHGMSRYIHPKSTFTGHDDIILSNNVVTNWSDAKDSDHLQSDVEGQHHQSRSCWRRCSHRHNKIVLLPTATNGNGGGLCDRATIFKTFINLAGYLCANVYVLPPDQLLGFQHRHGPVQSLKDVPWSDLMDLRLLPDNTSDTLQEYYNEEDDSTLFPDNETNTWQRVRAQARLEGNMKGITQSFERVEALSWKQQQDQTEIMNHTSDYFIWTIDSPFYMWADAFALYLQGRIAKQQPAESSNNTNKTSSNDGNENIKQLSRTMLPTIDPQRFVGCTYSALYPPNHMQVIADRVWDTILKKELQIVQQERLNKKSSTTTEMIVGYLHIRRTDTTKYCNTSLQRMQRFLECSLKDLAKKSGKMVVLLFSSDEKSSEYRQDIRNIILDNGYGHAFIDLDDMVRHAVQEDIELLHNGSSPESFRLNNYYIFHTTWTIARQHSDFQLSQRRDQNCPRCVYNVTLDNLPHESLELEGQRKGIRWTKKTRYLQQYFFAKQQVI